MEIKDLVREGAYLKGQIQESQARLREINAVLAGAANFNGKKSAKIEGDGAIAKVQLKENVSWDQDALNQSRATIGDEQFFGVFKWEFKPRSKKDLDGFLKHSPNAEAIRQAMTIKPGAPSVSYEVA